MTETRHAVTPRAVRARLLTLPIVALLLSTTAFAEEGPEETAAAASERPPGLGPDLEVAGEPRSRAEGPGEPARILGSLGLGLSVRMGVEDIFQQETLAPLYLDGFGAYVFAGRGVWRHGVGLGASLNLTDDGTRQLGVGAGEQFVLAPTYVGLLRLQQKAVSDYNLLVKAGLPLSLSPNFNPGVEVAGGFVLMFLSGLGVYAEAGLSVFLGAELPRGDPVSFHPLFSAVVGFVLDWEML